MRADTSDVPEVRTVPSPESDDVLAAGLRQLSDGLWIERALLDEVTRRAKVAQLMLASDEGPWSARAVSELEASLRSLRASDHTPARLLRAVGLHMGIGRDATLADLARHLDGEWRRTMVEHATALRRAVAGLRVITAEHRALSASGLAGVTQARALLLGETGPTYDDGGREVHADHSVSVDELA